MKTIHNRNVAALCLGVVLGGFSPRASLAQDTTNAPKSSFEQFAEQDYLFGTWGGLRTELSKHGVDFEFFYIASNPNNLSGGIQTGSHYEGAFLMLLDLDSKKLLGYDGGHLHVGGVSLHGHDHFSDERIGDLNKVNLIDFPNGSRLWELWYEQKLWDDKVSIKFGQMAVDQDFLQAEFYNSLANINLLNQTFFYPTLAFNVYSYSVLFPGFPGAFHALASSPYGAPGVRLKVQATDQIYAQFGAYDGFPDQTDGTHVKLSAQEGALLYLETGLRLNQRKEDTGLPGNIKLGAFYHTGDFPDNVSTFQSVPPGAGVVTFHPNTYGGYLLVDQMLFREVGKNDPAQQGLVGFFRLTGAPPDRNMTQFGVDGGLVYQGLIPTRDYDSIALAGSYLQMSDDIREGQRRANAIVPGFYPQLADYEAAVELSYKAQMTAWWTLHASIERAIHPGGRVTSFLGTPRDAWAFILASTLRF